MPDEKWGSAPTKSVIGKTYRNETVELDGHSYTGCRFINCTFVYRGRQPFDIVDNEIEGARRILVKSPRVHNFVQLLDQWDYLDPNVDDSEISRWEPDA